MALATNALTMITTCEAELGLTAGEQDALLTRYINTASDQIADYCNRKFYYESGVAEKIAGSGDAFLFVGRTPVTSITSIVWLGDDSTVSSSTYEVWDAGQGAIYSSNGWNNATISATDFTRYTVTYVGGWITPQQDSDDGALTRDLPFDLETACVNIVTALWQKKGQDRTVKSESIMGASVTYDNPFDGLDQSIKATLDNYKRMDRLEFIY